MPSGDGKGGAEEALTQLVERREEFPFEMEVVFLEGGPLVAKFASLGILCTTLSAGRIRNPFRFIKTVRQLGRIIAERGSEAVIGWMTKAHLYGGLAAWMSGVDACYFQMGLPDRSWIDRLGRRVPAKAILTCSEFAAREQRAVSRTRVIAVQLGMDEARFHWKPDESRLQMRRKVALSETRQVIGIVGRLQHWKGMHIFLEALALVLPLHPEIQGVVLGGAHDLEPGYSNFLGQEVKRMGLADIVHFAGAQPNVQEWMQAMDVVVHASEREPFGIVVVEAMALGRAVIASIPGGPEEMLVDGVHGLLVQSGDPLALARAIRRFLDDPALAHCCGVAARERALNFTATRYVKRLAEALRAALGTDRVEAPPASDEKQA